MMPTAPDALLFIAPGCPHCPQVLQALSDLVKQGALGRLEVINVAVHPEAAAALGVRSAPWTRIGEFELEGTQSAQELRRWVELAGQENAFAVYIEQLLTDGQLARAEIQLERHPERLERLLPLLEQPELPMQVRVGLGALFENFVGTATLLSLAEELGRLSRHADHRVRVDACYYLGLSGGNAAVSYLQQRLDDEHPEVREIAAEALQQLAG